MKRSWITQAQPHNRSEGSRTLFSVTLDMVGRRPVGTPAGTICLTLGPLIRPPSPGDLTVAPAITTQGCGPIQLAQEKLHMSPDPRNAGKSAVCLRSVVTRTSARTLLPILVVAALAACGSTTSRNSSGVSSSRAKPEAPTVTTAQKAGPPPTTSAQSAAAPANKSAKAEVITDPTPTAQQIETSPRNEAPAQAAPTVDEGIDVAAAGASTAAQQDAADQPAAAEAGARASQCGRYWQGGARRRRRGPRRGRGSGTHTGCKFW